MQTTSLYPWEQILQELNHRINKEWMTTEILKMMDEHQRFKNVIRM